jgi:ribosome-binding factor A
MPRSKPDSQGRSVRLLRVGEQVRHALADVLVRGDLRDDSVPAGLVTVSEVRLSPDLRHATVFVKAFDSNDDQALVKALAANARFLRGEVARRLATKYTPDLRFRVDESYDAGARIDAVLKRPHIARDLPPPDAVAETPPEQDEPE